MKSSIYLTIPVLFTLVINTVFNQYSGNHEIKQLEHKPIIMNMDEKQTIVELPRPRLDSDFSIEEVMQKRRSHRSFVKSEIAIEDLSQVLWAAYGITKPDNSRAIFRGGFRTAPSAGATFPLEIYAIVGRVKDIEPGVYRYVSDGHKLVKFLEEDVRPALAKAALNQEMIEDAPASLFLSAIFERTTERYGDRGRERYVCMEIGHVAQNVYLQAEALGLGTCAIGAFNDTKVTNVMQLPSMEEPLYILPIGKYYRD